MTTLSFPLNGTDSLQARADGAIRTWWNEMRASRTRRRLYLTTYRELAGLTDRDLQDIGISRYEIEDIARNAAREAAGRV